MGKLFAKVAFCCVFIHFLLVGNVVSRHLQYNVAELVSDGVSDGRGDESFLRLKGDDSEEECKLMYGFLPCSTNIWSHLFLIVIYEYLLYHGESYAGGDGRIFRVLGKNFGVSIFSQLLDSLPDSLILLATGLSCDQGKAQEYVVTGAGLLAGSSVLLLTLLWGTCFLFSRKQFTGHHSSSALLQGWGVHTDQETSFHATIMFYSLIPFVIILFPSLFGISYTTQEHKIVLLVSLSAAVICLISYFYYQYYDVDERIWKRRLAYAEVEQKIEMHVPFYEVQALMLDREKHLMTKQKEMEKELNSTEDKKESTMSNGKFYEMFEKWLDETRNLMDDPYSMDKKGTEYNQVVELLLEDKDRWLDLMTLMMNRAFGENLQTEDGKPDESAIDRFFDHINTDNDEYITQDELKAYYQEILVDDEIAEIIIRHLDNDGDGKIDKTEFRSGVGKWLASCKKRSQDSNGANDNYHRTEAKAKTKEKFKAIILLIVGILMITVLAEPLVESVRQFSESVNIMPFYVSFILVPLATNARTAIAAIRAAGQKRHHTTSFTFSEIYHKVFLNNILGFCVLVSVIYFRGFTWHFSAEILVVVIVCIIMGLLASFRSKFPDWTLLIAFPLYPLSMVVVYVVNDAFQFT